MAPRYAMGPKVSGTPTTRAVTARFTQPRRQPLPSMRLGAGQQVGPRTLVTARGFPGQPGPGAAPAPGPPSAPVGPAAMPVDPQYDAAVAIAQRNRDARLAALSGQRSQALNEYGFTPQTDAAGNVTAIAFDPTNHFSKAALMKKAWGQKRTGNTNSYAARGQLYAGSLQNAQDTANTGELQADDALKRALLAFIADNTAAGTAARSDFENAVTQAEADRLGRAPDNPLYEPVAPAGLPSTAAAQAAAAAGTSAAATNATPPPGSRAAIRAATARAVAARQQGHGTKALPRVRFKPGRDRMGPKTQRTGR